MSKNDIVVEADRLPAYLRKYFETELCGQCYICHLVEICREVRRVLRPDGVFWLNIGDSWAGGKGQSGGASPEHQDERHKSGESLNRSVDQLTAPKTTRALDDRAALRSSGIKPLDMVLIPEQLALALRADGWWLRSILIWAKGVSLSDEYNGNPMPESVNGWRFEKCRVKVGDNGRGKEVWRQGANETPQQDYDKDGNFKDSAVWQDCPGCPKCEKNGGYVLRKGSWRPTDSFEYVLMLTKTSSYFCDREAVLERGVYPAGESRPGSNGHKSLDAGSRTTEGLHNKDWNGNGGRNLRSVLDVPIDLSDAVMRIPTTGFKGAHFACVDADTECLTTVGWKRYNELRQGEQIATYDISARQLHWTLLQDVSVYPVTDSEMVSLEHRSLSMLLTPDHRCLVQGKGGVESIQSAGSLRGNSSIITSAPWRDEDVVFPVSEEVAALIGWYLTEGYEQKRGSGIEIYQSLSKNKEYVEQIRFLLAASHAEFEEVTFTRSWRGKPVQQTTFSINGFVAHKIRSLCPSKSFPSDVLLWSSRLLRALFDAAIKGDGNVRLDKRQFFVQKDKGRLDMFQAVAARLGYAASIFPRATDACSCVSIYERKSHRVLRNSYKSLLSVIRYTGVVWCPQTVDGTFVARRHGKMFITGNTFPPKLIEPLVKVATSEKGCCPNCGSPWARVIDKGFTAHDGETETQYQEGTNANRLALLRQAARQRGGEYGYDSKYTPDATGLPQQGFQRDNSVEAERVVSREEAKSLFPDDARKQQDYINHIHDHGGLDKGRTIGWLPTCGCQAGEPIPCRVLDPFAGAGTTNLVCERLGLDSIGIDTSAEYIQLAEARIAEDEQKRIDEQTKQLRREAKLANKNG